MNNIINYQWNGSNISFDLSGNSGTMINATEMAKAFGKRPVDWLKYNPAKEFISIIEERENYRLRAFGADNKLIGFNVIVDRNNQGVDLKLVGENSEVIRITSLIKIVKGNYSDNKSQGTWMHEDIALEFARWLNPKFGVWCNDRVKEILINGYSVLGTSREEFERAYYDLESKLKNVESENYYLKQSLDTQRTAESFCNAVFQRSENLYSMTDITKGLNFSVGRVEMYSKLEELGYMFKHKGIWRLKDPWSKQGFTKDILVQGKDGKYHNVMRWTDPGRAWIYSIGLRYGFVGSERLN